MLRALGLGAGLLCLAGFARLQTRRDHPLVPPELFSRPERVAPYAAGMIMGTTIFGVDTFVPLFVQGARGGTAVAAGAVVTPVVLAWSISAALAARAVLVFGFRRTARAGAGLILLGFAGLLAAAVFEAGIPWISVACAVIGSGLGPTGMVQVLGIQQTAPESQRGVATSLVPFFRAVGGTLGVGALGGILAAGLAERLGKAAEAAGELLSGRTRYAAAAGLDPHAVGQAIEASLLPVFATLLALAAVNLWVASLYAAADPWRPASGGLPQEGEGEA